MPGFRFDGFAWSPASGLVRMHYALEDGTEFEERMWFPVSATPPHGALEQAIRRALEGLYLAAGVSYYKLVAPAPIRLWRALAPQQAAFFSALYEQGLGEFAWQNGLDLNGKIHFPADGSAVADTLPSLALPRRSLVPLGGGKDSIVTLELLRQIDDRIQGFGLRPSAPIRAVADRSGLKARFVARRLAPELFALNRQGAPNGHVPITAIVCFAALACALICGFDRVVLSNERSASEASLTRADGTEINHQFSKSLAFEQSLADHVRQFISPTPAIFSLLRPWSEIRVAALFHPHLARYRDVFTSCNRAFHLQGSRLPAGQLWCGDCPKCRFVYLLLARHATPAALAELFGSDLLDRAGPLDEWRALCGLTDHKPFECVGEAAESAAMFVQLAQTPAWQAHRVVKALAGELAHQAPALEAAWQAALRPSDAHAIPRDWARRLVLEPESS